MKFSGKLALLVAGTCLSSVLVACGGAVDNEVVEEEPTTAEEVDGAEAEEEVAESGDGEEAYEAVSFTLVNDTDRPIIEFYISPPSEETWEENLIPEGSYIAERSELTVNVNDGRPDCAYDILAVFGPSADGSVGEGELMQSGVEICDGGEYVYSQTEAE
ncbi:MAG: hypothetical protein VKJ09_09150 [Leptolyngbya sp.]|nr:hypothetical protein [Leptolyngbya sp.]